MTWNALWEVLSAFAFGIFIAIIPIMPGEIYLAAGEATQLTGPILTGCGMGLGQGIGKAILFQMIKQGRKLPWRKKPKQPKAPPEPGTWRYRFDIATKKTIELIEHPRWGGLIIFSSAAISFPPNYPTTLFAPFTKIKWSTFSFWMTLGCVLRALVTALIINGVFDAWLR